MLLVKVTMQEGGGPRLGPGPLRDCYRIFKQTVIDNPNPLCYNVRVGLALTEPSSA